MKSTALDDGTTRSFLSRIRRHERLTREQEQQLGPQARGGCPDATEALVVGNLAFVAKIAGEYRDLGLPYDDLFNEGSIGLIDAAQRFDATRGTRFLTYAVFWIRRSIRQALNRQASTIRIPEHEIERARQAREEDPSAARPRLRMVSMDRTVGLGSASLWETLADEQEELAEDRILRHETVRRVLQAVNRLPRRERFIIRLRYGIRGTRRETLQEVGDRLGLSRERVRQIEDQAKARLRRLLGS